MLNQPFVRVPEGSARPIGPDFTPEIAPKSPRIAPQTRASGAEIGGPRPETPRSDLPDQPKCRLVVRCTAEFKRRLQQLADLKGITMSQVIEAGLHRCVDDWDTGRPMPRRWASRAALLREKLRRNGG